MSRRLSIALKESKSKPKVKFPDDLVFLDNIKENNIKEIKLMLRRTSAAININRINDTGLTVLHQAVLNNSIEVVKLLLENKANINSLDEEKWTPLHAAAFMNYHDISEYLLLMGANPMALTLENERPIDLVDPTNLGMISLFLSNMKLVEDTSNNDTNESDDYKKISDIFKNNTEKEKIIEEVQELMEDINNNKEFVKSLVKGLCESCLNKNETDENCSFQIDDVKCSVLKYFINLTPCSEQDYLNSILDSIAIFNIPISSFKTFQKNSLITEENFLAWKEMDSNQEKSEIIEYINQIF